MEGKSPKRKAQRPGPQGAARLTEHRRGPRALENDGPNP